VNKDVHIRMKTVYSTVVNIVCARRQQWISTGVYLDTDVSMAAHVTGIIPTRFAALLWIAACGVHCHRTGACRMQQAGL